MQKKFLSIILSAAMLTMASVPALAAMPTTELTVLDDTTVSVGTTGVSVDDFDHIDVGTVYKDYPRGTTSTVFRSNSTQNNNPMTIVSAGDASDPSDNVILVKRSVNGSGILRSKYFSVQSGYVSEVTYDIRFRALPTAETVGATKTSKFLGYDGSGGIDLAYDSDSAKWYLWSVGQGAAAGKLYPSLDKWYTVRATVDGNGLLKTYLMDKETGEVFVTADRSKCGGSAFSGDKRYFIFLYLPSKFATTDDSFQVEINNARMAVYDQTTNTPAVAKSNISEYESGVPTIVDSIEISFDQDIKTAPESVTLTAEGKAPITAAVSKASKKLNTYTLAVAGLANNAEYTVDLSGFKNALGSESDNFSFTTADAVPYVLSSTPANGADNVSVDTKSITVSFHEVIVEYPQTVTLEGDKGSTITASVATTDEKTFTFTWTEVLKYGEKYTLSLAGLTNEEGNSSNTEEISFTVQNLKLFDGVDISSAVAGSAGKTDITFAIEALSDSETYTGNVMAVAYEDGTMSAFDIVEASNLAVNGNVTLSFGLGTLSENAKIGIILFDLKNGPIPLAGGMQEN